jgi:hypothetical protein
MWVDAAQAQARCRGAMRLGGTTAVRSGGAACSGKREGGVISADWLGCARLA